MELKNGYKQTEIGVIPNDWEVKSLGECLKIKHGKDQKSVEDKNGKFPILGTGGLMNYTNSFLCDKPSVLIGRKGTIDKPQFMDTPFWTVDTLFYSEILKNNSAKFLYYNFLLIDWYSYNESSGVPSLNAKTIEKISIPVPTLKEQTAIAKALSDTDDWINSLEQLIIKKRQIKQGAMQDLLQPKEGWGVKSIIELAENKKNLFDDGDWVEAEHITNNGVRLIQTGNIGIGKYIEKESKKYISEESFLVLRCKPLIEGDLLICRLAEPAGRACIFPNIGEYKLITSVDVTIFRPRNEIVDRVFLSHLFSTSEWFQKITERVGGTTHKRISRSSLGSIKISIPQNIKEQTRIAAILSDMDADIDQLEAKLNKAKQVKQGMMQDLLTGRIRLVKN
jgi:type I restriction enzyme S subunit